MNRDSAAVGSKPIDPRRTGVPRTQDHQASDVSLQSSNGALFTHDAAKVLHSIHTRDQGGDEKSVAEALRVLTTRYEEYNDLMNRKEGDAVLKEALSLAAADRASRGVQSSHQKYHVALKMGSTLRAEQDWSGPLVLSRGPPETWNINENCVEFIPLRVPVVLSSSCGNMSRLQLMVTPIRETTPDGKGRERLQVLHFGGNADVELHYHEQETTLHAQELKLVVVDAPVCLYVGIFTYEIHMV